MEFSKESNDVNVEHLLRESRERVFEGSNLNRLQCCIVLFSLCTLYSISHTFVDALFKWVARELLPTSNCFPRTSYEMKSVLMKFRLNHRQVHCCPNGHVLYEEENVELEECPTCNQPHYIDGSNKVPQQVVRYFDVIQHFFRIFKCLQIAKHITRHATHKSWGRKMHSIVDNEQRKAIDRAYLDFPKVLTNLRLRLVGNGIILYKNNSLKHSTWVLLITIYNLLPWLFTKKFFISLAILVLGPKSLTVENIDVFLRPLVWDLMKLWTRIPK